MSNITVILIGKSSVGKDTLLQYMIDQGYSNIVSHTTRPIRDGEIDGQHYHFITKTEFLQMQNANEFLQTRVYNTVKDGITDTWYYGLHKNNLKYDKDNVVIFDVQGAKDFCTVTGANVLVVHLLLDEKERKARAQDRGSFCEQEWERRAKDDDIRFSNSEVQSLAPVQVYTKGMTTEEIYNTILPFIKVLKSKS